MKLFLTGGMGYIGSHIAVSLLDCGYSVIIFDNLETSSKKFLNLIKSICPSGDLSFVEGDLRDKESITNAMNKDIDAVIHLAGYKNVKDSCINPLRYYENNVCGSVNLFTVMESLGIDKLIFSSSAAVYGNIEKIPVKESFPTNPQNPYGKTKLMIEEILEDLSFNSIILRYFNVLGAHPSGELGENPDVLLNFATRIFASIRSGYDLVLYGDDYDTPDGSQMRDYIHVSDLANAHVKALERLGEMNSTSEVYNISRGEAISNLQLIDEISEVTGEKVKFSVGEGDSVSPEEIYAEPILANYNLNWYPKYDYHDMIEHVWKWYQFYDNTLK